MTIFDTIRYPVIKTSFGYSISPPEEINLYWQRKYPGHFIAQEERMIVLKRLILEYNTDECEITNPRIFKSRNKDLYK